MATKNNPGKYDCYENAHPDEPMFVLLGRDKHAPTLVWLWATLRELEGENPEKVEEARTCCFAMMEWAKAHDRKVAGLGQATLAGLMELIRGINTLVRNANPTNMTDATSIDEFRVFMSQTLFEGEPSREAATQAPEVSTTPSPS